MKKVAGTLGTPTVVSIGVNRYCTLSFSPLDLVLNSYQQAKDIKGEFLSLYRLQWSGQILGEIVIYFKFCMFQSFSMKGFSGQKYV